VTIRADNGPARVIAAGSGYWSCDSQTRVFPKNAQKLQIRWLGGMQDTVFVPANVAAFQISRGGKIETLP
jgi:hypothetical protein